MKRLCLSITILLVFQTPFAQNPDWGTLIALDRAEMIVMGRMHVEDKSSGSGTIIVEEVIRGEAGLEEVKVRFTGQKQEDKNSKQIDPPEYRYEEGQEGIWVLADKSGERYDLRQANLYYEVRWKTRIKTLLRKLAGREWTAAGDSLSASVIIDSVGANKKYRFFYLVLRNDGEAPVYINTHYRIKEAKQQRIQAEVISPYGDTLDMLTGEGGCRLAGEPGWAYPEKRDFALLEPGEKVYLFASGALRCFFCSPASGSWELKLHYRNDQLRGGWDGRTWVGEVVVRGAWRE